MAQKKFSVAQFVTEYLASRPGVTAGYAFSMLIFPLAVVVVPAIMGMLLDRLKNREPFSQWRHLLVWILVCFLLLLAGYQLGAHVDSFVKPDVQAYARRRVFSEVMAAYSHNYHTVQVSSIVSKVMALPAAIFSVLSEWRTSTVPGVVTLVAIIAYFAYIDWRLGAIFLLMTGLVAGVMYAAFYVCVSGMIASEYENDVVHEQMGDVLDNLMHVYLADATEAELERLDARHASQLRHTEAMSNRANLFVSISQVLMGLVTAASVYYAWVRFKQNKMQFDLFLGAIFVLACARHVVYGVLASWPKLINDTGILHKMEHYINALRARATASPHPTDHSEQAVDRNKGISFRNVTFRYDGKDSPVLEDVSFEIAAGDVVRVSGHIGSGKSTLALLSLGLFPFTGEIFVCGRDVRSLSRAHLSGLISYVPQNPRLLDRTLLENLTFGTQSTRAEIEDVLRRFKVEFIGLDDRVGKAGSFLSTGQRAMVYLMRAVLKNTPIIICDEVTSNMDKDSEARVLGLLKDISKDRTLMFISHSSRIDLPFTKHLTVDNGVVGITELQ